MLFRCLNVLFLFTIHAPVVASETVEWFTDDKKDIEHLSTNTPYSIGSDTLNLLLDSFSDLEIHLRLASLSRINSQLENTINSCTANRIKTPAREAKNIFSLPMNIHPLAKLYFIEGNIAVSESILNNKGEIESFSELLKENPQKVLGLAKGASYGNEIDLLLKQVKSESLVYFDSDDRYSMGLKLLFDNLVDFYLGYPSSIQKYAHVNEDIWSRVVSIPIQQEKQFLVTHVACSDSELGRKVISVINKQLIQLYGSYEHKQAHLTHLPESDYQAFIKEYDAFFSSIKKAHPSH